MWSERLPPVKAITLSSCVHPWSTRDNPTSLSPTEKPALPLVLRGLGQTPLLLSLLSPHLTSVSGGSHAGTAITHLHVPEREPQGQRDQASPVCASAFSSRRWSRRLGSEEVCQLSACLGSGACLTGVRCESHSQAPLHPFYCHPPGQTPGSCPLPPSFQALL